MGSNKDQREVLEERKKGRSAIKHTRKSISCKHEYSKSKRRYRFTSLSFLTDKSSSPKKHKSQEKTASIASVYVLHRRLLHLSPQRLEV